MGIDRTTILDRTTIQHRCELMHMLSNDKKRCLNLFEGDGSMDIQNYIMNLFEKNGMNSSHFNVQALEQHADVIRKKVQVARPSKGLMEHDPIFSHIQKRGNDHE